MYQVVWKFKWKGISKVSSYYMFLFPLVECAALVSVLISAKHLPHLFTLVTLHSPQHHFVQLLVVLYSSASISSLLSLFLLIVCTALKTAGTALDINCNRVILFSNVILSPKFLKWFPHSLLRWRIPSLSHSCRDWPCSELLRVMPCKTANGNSRWKRPWFLQWWCLVG